MPLNVNPLLAAALRRHWPVLAALGVVLVFGVLQLAWFLPMSHRYRDAVFGVAFHRQDDNSYEAVYLRPFNFRATEPDRHQHAVQYMALPDYDWPRLRKEFPEEFENPVDASVSPTEWIPLRIVVSGQRIQIHVGGAKTPALEVRKLGSYERGAVGLWTGNNSDGDFSNLRITAPK